MVPVGESGTVDVIEEADGYFDSREPGFRYVLIGEFYR